MEYTVRLTSRANRESNGIFEYIHARAPEGALRWYRALLDALETLSEFPNSHGRAPEGMQFDVDVRQILFKTPHGRKYRALSYVDEEQRLVHVVSVRGPAQDLLSLEEIDDAKEVE